MTNPRGLRFFLRGQEVVQIHGFKLSAGHGLFQGREPEYGAEYGGHSPVVGEGLIVKDQVLQGALFDGLQDKTVGAVDGGDDLYGAALQGDGFLRAVSQPRQMVSSITGFFLSTEASLSCMEMARIGQTFSHFPQETHSSGFIFGR